MQTDNQSFDLFLGRQPILDTKRNIIGYELLFRDGYHSHANVQDDFTATAAVITRAFSEFGISPVLGRYLGFININEEFLLSDLVELLPKRQVVLELLERTMVDRRVIARCRQLKEQGFLFAIDDLFEREDPRTALLDVTDIVKIDMKLVDKEKLPQLVRWLKLYPIKLLAEKVDSPEDVQFCTELGFELFQGYYFAKPLVFAAKRNTAPSRLVLLRLMALVLSDAAHAEIQQVFKQNPDLSYSLMRLVNSVAMGLPYKISSLSQALLVLGRRQLQRWLQLLLFTHQNGEVSVCNALTQLAAMRGRFMELLCVELPNTNKDYEDRAFMTGILSLLDTLLNMPVDEIADQLNLSDDIKHALLSHEGQLGQMLKLTKLLEQNDFPQIKAMIDTMKPLTMRDLTQLQMRAMQWANDVGIIAPHSKSDYKGDE